MDAPEGQAAAPAKPPFYQRKEFPFLAVFGGLVLVLLLSTAFSGRPPAIDRIFQEDNLASAIITIGGRNFGAPGAGGEVRIGDLTLTPSNYLNWSDTEIVVSIPREVPSGLIYVVTKNGKCRGDIFMNPDEIPRLTSYRGPLIARVSSTNVAPGRVLVITGERFGAERASGRVSFTQAVPLDGRREERDSSERLINASDGDGDYLAWSDREIRVRVPDGAKTGLILVATDKGQSNFVYLTVISPAGKKEYKDRAGYRLRSGAVVTVNDAVPPNSLSIFLPLPVAGPEQRQIKREPAAAAGPAVFSFTGLETGRLERVAAVCGVERYAVSVLIDPDLITADYDRTGAFYLAFTGDDPLLSPSHPALAGAAQAAAGTEKNPYKAARKIYDYIIAQFSPDSAPSRIGAPDWYAALKAKTGDAFRYAALFTALARRSGIPARLVAGCFVDSSRAAHPHYWSEFYIEDFGWLPADPFLGEGTPYGSSPATTDPINYYFGSLDNRHIAFVKGLKLPERTDPRDRTAAAPGTAGLAPYFAGLSGGIKSCAATWEGVTVLELK